MPVSTSLVLRGMAYTQLMRPGRTGENMNTSQEVLEDLNQRIVAQPEATKALVLALLASENVVMLGPPGEGKSMIAAAIADYTGGTFFKQLLDRFSTPTQLFGYLSKKELDENDRYVRKHDHAAKAEVVFLDEIFKANGELLNSVLSLLNEREVFGLPVPTKIVIGASNEMPEGIGRKSHSGGDSLLAFWDRFTLRTIVTKPQSTEDMMRIMSGDFQKLPSVAGWKNGDLHKAQAEVDQMAASASKPVMKALLAILSEIYAKMNISTSSRRMGKSLRVAAASAYLRGGQKVEVTDLKDLNLVLWQLPEQRAEVEEIVLGKCAPHLRVIKSSLSERMKIEREAQDAIKSGKDGATIVNIFLTLEEQLRQQYRLVAALHKKFSDEAIARDVDEELMHICDAQSAMKELLRKSSATTLSACVAYVPEFVGST